MKGFFMLMSRPAERTHRYGEVYSFEPGPSDVVIFGSLATVKEIMKRNSGLFLGPTEGGADGSRRLVARVRVGPITVSIEFGTVG